MQLLVELPVAVWHPCPAVTEFNHMRPMFHQEQSSQGKQAKQSGQVLRESLG